MTCVHCFKELAAEGEVWCDHCLDQWLDTCDRIHPRRSGEEIAECMVAHAQGRQAFRARYRTGLTIQGGEDNARMVLLKKVVRTAAKWLLCYMGLYLFLWEMGRR